MKASAKRVPYQVKRNPADHDIPDYMRGNPYLKTVPRPEIGVIIMALECRNGKGQTLFLRQSALVHSDKQGDWDYNTLEPYLVRLQQEIEFTADKFNLNRQRYIDPRLVPDKDAAKAPKI